MAESTVHGSDDRARRLADRYWNQILELEPLMATQVGEERFDHRLRDPGPDGLARRESVHRGAVQELAGFDRGDLQESARTALDVVEAFASTELAAIRYRFDRFDAADHMWGPGTMLAQIGSLQRADTPERLERYQRRLAAVPAFLAASGGLLMEAADSGTTSPRLAVDRTIAQVERLLRLDPSDSPAIPPVPESDPAGREQVAAVVRETVYPAYVEYLGALRDYHPFARESIGLGELPGGDELYAATILAWTSLPLDADEVHGRGMDELARIQEERRAVAARLGAPDAETAIARRAEAGGNAFGSRQDVLRVAEEQVRLGWEAAPAFFGRLPRENCVVRPVDPSREDDVLEYYQPPTADGSRPGVYYVNTKDPTKRSRHRLATTSFHEANPGHHFQIAIEQEAEDRADIRRFASDLIGGALGEGWGLYSERLADEMGLFQDDYERLGMLEMQAFRAARLVVDTGIHAFGWNRDRAVDTMASTGEQRTLCELEVDRYVAMPGQALCYTIGRQEIERWREAARDRMGAAFSLRDFHDRVLELGTLPLASLNRELGAA